MSCILQKRTWLAGASLLAIILGSGDADAVVFGGPGGAEYTIPSTGYYEFTVAGANGGGEGSFFGGHGGNGAVVGGELFFHSGDTLDIVVGGGGGSGDSGLGYGGGGGGGSFVFDGGLLFAAGGGGGAGFSLSPGGPGIGSGGHPSGPANYGGGGGAGVATGVGNIPAYGQMPATAGSFPFGGVGTSSNFGSGPAGGYGGGGIGPANGGGGGYSYVINTARNAFGITGGNMNGYTGQGVGADGYLSTNFVAAPEPSTWAMMLLGFAGLGFMGWRSQRSRAPAV
jgi:PEP-CTERM motif